MASAERKARSWVTKSKRARELPQIAFEPLNRVDVEVVRRLVEQQQVGLGHERLAEQRSPPPAARELAERPIRRQRQPRHDGLDALLEPPAVALLELVLQVAQARQGGRARGAIGPRPGHLNRGMVVLRDERPKRSEPGRHLVEDRAVGRPRHVLIEPRHPQSRGPPDRSAVGRDIAGNHLEQARFSGPVAANQADALPRFNPQAGVVEQGEEAERKRDAVQSE